MKNLLFAIPAVLPGVQISAVAQVEMVPSGTEVTVRTNEGVDSRDADGRVFVGSLEHDVLDRDGRIAIPRGSQVELISRRVSPNEMVLDLESIAANGRRYTVAATEQGFSGEENGGG